MLSAQLETSLSELGGVNDLSEGRGSPDLKDLPDFMERLNEEPRDSCFD